VLLAPNGWGKTTLLEAMMGLVPIDRGNIKLNGRSIQQLSTWQRVKLGISLLQSRENTFQSLTVREMLKITGTKRTKELGNIINCKMSDLSGGEKQRVLLQCRQSRMMECELLDEPFLALDNLGVKSLMQSITNNYDHLHLLAIPSIGSKVRENHSNLMS
jgi:ABC-type branched-subunit amino acid transport system ATPase component